MKPKIIIIDPGHGMGNRQAGRYDPGAVADGTTEASIVMQWANVLRSVLRARGVAVVRTRIDHIDPAPIGQRAAIARQYNGDVMVSLHCNAFNGSAQGTETFYRGEQNRAMAAKLNQAVCQSLHTTNRGVKTEGQSQHARLAVMSFQPCFLIEIGFIDHAGNRAKMLDPDLRKAACMAMAGVLLGE
jgi:N-acetylmuramoyl-L-alanine amidase